MTWPVWLTVVACLLASVFAGLHRFGAKRWAGTTRALTRRLEAARTSAMASAPFPARYDPRELVGLPAPVQRYFRAVLRPGQPIIAAVTVEQAGTLNMSVAGEQWKPFTARQRIVIHRPGFLWDAKVALLPGLPVRVLDGYVAGEGVLRARVLGLFPVADLHGGGEIARGELMRYFSETAWYPTALLPSQGVRWDAVDDRSANATLADGPLALTLLFRFDDRDRIESARAATRGATVGKQTVMLPWEGRWTRYEERDGMTVPVAGEALWIRPDGPKVYWRGSITSLEYEFVP